MKNVSRVMALSMCVVSAMACGHAVRPSGSSGSELRQALHDGVWELTVDRALRAAGTAVGAPMDQLSESDFAPVVAGATYRLAVSQGAARIAVVEPRMVGQLEQATAERLTYALSGGTFAGGRIVVWREPRGLQAELTIYGSGVPIVKSERGSVREVQ